MLLAFLLDRQHRATLVVVSFGNRKETCIQTSRSLVWLAYKRGLDKGMLGNRG